MMRVLLLNKAHDRQRFDCGDASLNTWLKQTARQHQEKKISSTFVAVKDDIDTEILGFYAINLAELINADFPEQYKKRLPMRVPVFRLGRLAIALQHQGKGIGEILLFDAIDRVRRVAIEVGGIGIVVHAKPSAIKFYKRYGFEQMSDYTKHLFLPFLLTSTP